MSELDPVLLRAIAAARAERPASERGKTRALDTLRLGAVAGVGAASGSASFGAARMIGASRLLAWPWWTLSFALFVGGREAPSRVVEPTPAVVAVAVAPVPSGVAAIATDAPDVPTLAVSDLPDARVASVRPPDERAVARAVAPPVREAALVRSPDVVASGTSLRDEIDALGVASHALSDRRCASARRALAAYRSAFPAGKLEREADVVEVEILGRSGDLQGARAAARRFVGRFPGSPYVLRLGPWLREDGAGASVAPCIDTTP